MSDGIPNPVIKILSILLAIFLVLSIPLALISQSTLRVLTSPEILSQTLSRNLLLESGWREGIATDVVLALFPNRSQDTQWFSDLSSEARQNAAQILFPDAWVEAQIRALVSSFVAWFESDTPFGVDVVPLRSFVSNDASLQLAEMAVVSWPGCNPAQAQSIQEALQRDSLAGVPYCQPSGEIRGDFVSALDRWLQNQIQAFEPNLVLAMKDGIASLPDSIAPVRSSAVAFLILLMRLRWIPVLCLGLLMLVRIRSSRELGRWWGVPVLLGSALSILGLLLGYALGPVILERSLAPFGSEGIGVLRDLTRLIITRSLVLSGFLLVSGAILVIYRIRTNTTQYPAVDVPDEVDEEPAPTARSAPPPIKPFRPDENE